MIRSGLHIAILLLLSQSIFAQDQLYVQGPLVLQPGAEVFVQGGLHASKTAILQNDGEIALTPNESALPDNWTNESDYNFLSGKGMVIFGSAHAQTITGNGQLFHQVIVDNNSSEGVTLGVDMEVEDSLQLTQGIVHTTDHQVTLNNGRFTALGGEFNNPTASSYVDGTLERAIEFNHETYWFPVGTELAYHPLQLDNHQMSGPSTFSASFETGVPAMNNQVEESELSYTSICESGTWMLTPDQTVVGGTYTVKPAVWNMDCDLADNQFAPLFYDAETQLWDCKNCGIGVGINDLDESGRLVSDDFALRKDLKATGRIALGRICRIPQLASDTTFCDGDMLDLSVGSGYREVRWTDAQTGDLLALDTAIFIFEKGLYAVVTEDRAGCIQDDTVAVESFPNPTFELGNDTITCPEELVKIGVDGPYKSFEWSNGAVQRYIQVNSEKTYVLTVTDFNNCKAQDEITVQHFPSPIIEPDQPTTTEDLMLEIDVLANDTHTEPMDLEILIHPLNGLATLNGNTITYEPDPGFWGRDSLTYQLCEQRCALNCTSTTLYIQVEDDMILEVPEGFSPDGDGVNDGFVVEGIESYPDNEIVIHDRWGDVVFQASPYLNDWKGEANRGPRTVSSEIVPEGSYFYVLHLAPGQPDKKGYIVVEY